MLYFQYTAVAILIILELVFGPISGNVASSFCLVAILVFGIPHGAVDHKVHLSISSKKNLVAFIVKYLAVAGLYILVWILNPPIGLIFFLLLSAYHFGQELLENQELTGNTVLIALGGLFIIFAPLLFHYQEAYVFLETIAPNTFPALDGSVAKIIAFLITIFFVVSVFFYALTKRIQWSQAINLYAFIGMIISLNLFLSFLIAFTAYFILFHSLNAFQHQYFWLKKKNSNYSLKKFLVDLLGFSLLAIVGILFLLWILKPTDLKEIISYFFILTSIITLPHAITLDHFYKGKDKLKEEASIQ